LIYNKKAREFKVVVEKPLIPTLLIIVVSVFGTAGYYIIWYDEGVTILDALYMVMITITTIGFQEVLPLTSPTSKIFTMFVALVGISSLFYLFSNIMENLFLYQTMNIRGRKKMKKYLQEINDHFIIVGYGRVGRLAAYELLARNQKFVVIDSEISDSSLKEKENDFHIIQGDATEDDILKLAGIERAKSIIVATAKAEVTVFVVLSAKELNPKLNVVARADDESDINKLKKAGADKVVNPYAAGGYQLASLASNQAVVGFYDTSLKEGKEDFIIEKVSLSKNSTWIGKTLKDLDVRKKCGTSIIRVIRKYESVLNPEGNFIFKADDQIVAVGNHRQLQRLEEYTR